MRVKIKLKCEECGKIYYNHITVRNLKDATRYKKIFKDNNAVLHWLEDKCEGVTR